MQYGTVTIDNQQYLERAQIFPYNVDITLANQVLVQQRVTLPGVANFLLKGLTREVTQAGISVARRFKFRLGNSDGTTWYIAGGIGSPTDRAVDTLCFGTGQFPYPIIPGILYGAGASIQFEIEDISAQPTYTINFAFHGAYLIPVAS
jgi:hypothetical protein